ncbi:SLC13 family permease [Lachnobacterium bovis]|uniref:Na+/H+ antiporter NhaD n=1 Tax=Lachnobacterium bovis DSM 14045 TaxID=1122142 RepID=A0A1H3KPV8_9FIRM|nr:SLC13 family permease [Lachnobacterium bovis]SDY54056.1 Na+/H+ antiporter NhaD [Lachnobacterium bovis DSM 14045]
MNLKNRLKKIDIVLAVAWILAVISAFFVHPSVKYVDYIDFRSLGILWGLMVIIQGLRYHNIFEKIAQYLLEKVSKQWQLVMVLVFMCFLGSMLITNDVALITFVPFSIMILKSCNKEKIMIPVIVLQTIAANLGSMLTPIGNPQNLYMYGLTKMNFVSFVKILLPYSVVSTVLIIIAIFVFTYDKEELDTSITDFEIGENSSKYKIIMYSVLFLIAISSVLRMIPWYVFVVVVLFCVGFFERKILFKADYILLLTFVGFFIFTGNMGKLEIVRSLLESVLKSHEFAVGIVTSQFISNVPATLMLSGFAKNYRQLLIGVNVGGLGTLIASMASLISYKAYVKEYRQGGGEFIKIFTLFNVVFLIALVGVNAYFYGGL